jgi:putative addiction module killer protein
MGYTASMNIINETEQFSEWLEALRDMKAKMRLVSRIVRARAGNFGDCRVLDEGICEMRVDYGPGYRIYYAQDGIRIYLLLIGGDKSSQQKDILKAKTLWKAIKEQRQ